MENRNPAPGIIRAEPSVLVTNKVLRNTYLLLSMTLLFSGAMAGVAMMANMPPINPWITLIGYFALLFGTQALRNSSWGLVMVFLLTGFMGLTLGPIINLYLNAFANGNQLVMTALGGTGAVFLGLSGYAISSKKAFSYMGGFLVAGILVAFLAGLGALLFSLPTLMLVVSALFILLMSGLILFETSNIIHGGETNYVMATVTLYVAIYNLFTSLLHLLGAFMGDD